MRLIKSLFVAIMAIIVTTIVGSTFTHLFEETKDVQQIITKINNFLGNIVYAEETEDTQELDTQHNANHTFTTSLNIHTPSMVIDDDLPTPHTNTSQSPTQEETEEVSEYVDILDGLVPISTEDVDYERVLGISIEEIRNKIENDGMNIWEIAEEVDEVQLLENTYYAIYPAIIIEMFNNEEIAQQMADILIQDAINDIENHENVSVEVMVENMLNSDLS